jgi:asparagine synthetase B (glutamine-hydrolysing)
LSSGLDSGGIEHYLKKHKIKHAIYSIAGQEDMNIIQKRIEYCDDYCRWKIITVNTDDSLAAKALIKKRVEDYQYVRDCVSCSNSIMGKNMLDIDPASVGLGLICKQASKDGYQVHISGTGADEIYSDYGYQGIKV